METQTTAISIREMTDADLPAVLEIFNREVVASPYLYVETPLTLDDRRAWLAQRDPAGASVRPVIRPKSGERADRLRSSG